MVQVQSVVDIGFKGLELILNVVIIVLYRIGGMREANEDSRFLGIGGAWNLYDERTPDVEIIASGVLVGYFIYTIVMLTTYCLNRLNYKKTIVDHVMSFFGAFLFIAIGAMCIHFWLGYKEERPYLNEAEMQERTNGLWLGSLCIIEGLVFLGDLGFNAYSGVKEMLYED